MVWFPDVHVAVCVCVVWARCWRTKRGMYLYYYIKWQLQKESQDYNHITTDWSATNKYVTLTNQKYQAIARYATITAT